MDADGQRVRQGCDEVAAAALLERQDGLAPDAGVAAEREHRNTRIDAGTDHQRFAGFDSEGGRACRTPSGGGSSAAAALQRRDQIEDLEHVASVAAGGDKAGWRPTCDQTLTDLRSRTFNLEPSADLPFQQRRLITHPTN
ncbi:hypothetical protein MPRG_09350 [Mycobacterium paragordonae]|uniref:DUF222 domain-containing protein n=1 Tax=Mycobacterium paragordonae TaxID=1389713 RepID=A0ABQ1BZS0_9MYCO|nr:hypothetical protein MPRG_09350 [Mycobacterium paragordonae]